MEEQAGNALNDIDFNQAPEAELPASDSKSSEDFFEALDRSVNGVIQDEVQAPESMKDKFELDEDFVFDPDEAMSDTGSDSAKVLNATIDGVVQRRLNETLSKQQMENRRLSDEASFRAQHDLTQNQWEDFRKFAKNKTLELEDILDLKNRETREQNIAKEASKGVAAHMRDTQSRPRSLATSGSAQVDKSADDQIFDSILGSDREFDNIFGQ